MMKLSELLIKAKALIDAPEKWTQEVYARDKANEPVDIESSDACKFCSAGALYRINDELAIATHTPHKALINVTQELTNQQLTKYNDCHTHEEVMKMWDLAIEKVIQDEINSR